MSIKATLNQKPSVTIYRGEDFSITFYLYDAATFEPVDLTGKTVNAVLSNFDNTRAAFAGTFVTDGTDGKFSITMTDAETTLLASGNAIHFQLEITTTSSGDIDIEVLTNIVAIVDPTYSLT